MVMVVVVAVVQWGGVAGGEREYQAKYVQYMMG
jgi:hypothetical protein